MTLPGSPLGHGSPSLLLGVMEGGRMRREEVSFLQAHCEMERLRDGQMTMAGRPGPESRLGGRPTPCYVLAPAAALSAPSRGLRRRVFFWQGDPLGGPLFPSTFHPLLPVLPASPPLSSSSLR